jgi:hypothetical protein
MATKIDTKITAYEVVTESAKDTTPVPADTKPAESNVVHMHEKLERPETLVGSTYKIKTPLTEHALYVTINDIVLNPGTQYEKRRPFEIFINSKSMDHFQWVVALTRVISAVFRKGGDATFLVEELRSVFDPRGGYFKRGRYIPSLVAELGDAIERHMMSIGMIAPAEPDAARKQLIEEKLQAYRAQHGDTSSGSSFPPEAQLCAKCSTKAVIRLDGCMTCLNCGESKCG